MPGQAVPTAALMALVLLPNALAEFPSCTEQQRLHRESMVGETVWPGFHIMCVVGANTGQAGLAFEDGSRLALPPSPTGGGADEAWTRFLEKNVRSHLDAQKLRSDDPTAGDSTIVRSQFDWSRYRLPWRVFSEAGRPVDTANAALSEPTLYLYEGGQFLWPGLQIGLRRNVTVQDGEDTMVVSLTTLSMRPLAFRVRHFLSGEECKHIVKVGRGSLRPSQVVQMASEDPNAQGVAAAHQSRTSSNGGISRGATPTVLRIEQRAHDIMRLPYELGEDLQIVQYKPGQKYEAHRDFFHPNDYYDAQQMLDTVDCGGRNRLATLFWYLNTVKEGGETYFPRALNESGREFKPWNYDYTDCYRGLAVKAKQGSAVLFYSMLPNTELDERALHGGCPPAKGGKSKWGANQWVYNKVHTRNDGPCEKRRNTRSDL